MEQVDETRAGPGFRGVWARSRKRSDRDPGKRLCWFIPGGVAAGGKTGA